MENTTVEGGYIKFVPVSGDPITVQFSEFVTRDGTVEWGNNSANRIAPYTLSELGLTSPIEWIHIRFGGSAGTDNFLYSATPEPGTYALFGMALLGMAVRRRRQRAREVREPVEG